MLGNHFWELHRPDRSMLPHLDIRPAKPASASAPATWLGRGGVAVLAAAILFLLALAHVDGVIAPALIVVLAAIVLLVMHGIAGQLSHAADRMGPLPASLDARPAIQAVDVYAAGKRAIDLIAAACGAIVVLPLLPLIALVIRLDSPGPIFYSQDRVGQDGRIFRIHKFRSMRVDAERDGATWAAEHDPRVTRVGAIMRRSRIDEIPQLVNVLRGEMTLVGPRPERPEFTRLLERELPGYAQRSLVKPGLTGWAQIRYRYASSIQDSATKLDYDLYYVRHRSLRFDARILCQTIPVILHRRGR